MPRMQTLGISNSPGSDNIVKRLLWPSIQNSTDVDTLGVQGYWICAIVAAISLATAVVSNYVVIETVAALLFYAGGVGVREHNRYAAHGVRDVHDWSLRTANRHRSTSCSAAPFECARHVARIPMASKLQRIGVAAAIQ